MDTIGLTDPFIIRMNTISATEIRRQMKELANPKIAEHSQGFFKTGPGEYGAGDKFIGIRMPVLRRLAKENQDLSIKGTLSLLRSKIHEERLLALIILTLKYQHGDDQEQKSIFDLYCANTTFINNWDLVDCSAHKIVGHYLLDRSRQLLYRFAKSSNLWERRIAIFSTYTFIKADDYDDTLTIAEVLLDDEEDLIHKAVGWMLREIGNRDREVEEIFLRAHYQDMPRTMLRYAIEKFPQTVRKRYLAGTI